MTMPALARTPRARTLFLLAALAASVTFAATPSHAVPADLTLDRITPMEGGDLLVARTAADNPLDPPTFQLKADIFLDNSGAADHEISSVTFTYPGSAITPRTYSPMTFPSGEPPAPFTIPAGDDGRVLVHDGLDRDLPTPLPASVTIEVFFDSDPVPLELDLPLRIRDNEVPNGAFFFPAKASDLNPGELWTWSTRHSVDSGGGGGTVNPSGRTQRYALDVDVVRWDSDGGAWTSLKAGTTGDTNDDFLGWEKPYYSMGDGTITRCYRGEADHQPGGFDEISFDFLFGNSLFIEYGGDQVTYAHMKDGSISSALCPNEGENTGLSIPVEAGQFLGVMGNTGRSTGPHLHFQSEDLPLANTVEGVPMQFLNMRALGHDTTIQSLGESPTLRPLHGMTMHKHSLFLPNPCGLDDLPAPGFTEVARHGITADCYQDVFNQITSRGYRPVFVDAYDVGGDLRFNATFRAGGPASIARHGLTGAEYQDLFDDLTGDGWRLHQVDSYVAGGGVRYAAIFEVRDGPAFAAFHGLTDAEYADQVATLSAAGYVAVNVSTVEAGGQLLWTGLFEQVPVTGWTVETVPVAAYQATFDANVAAGRIPTYVHGFSTAGGPYLTGIWVDPMGGATAAVHGLSSAEYQDAYDTNLGAARLTRAVTGYEQGGGARFAAVWRVRPDTEITSTPPAVTNQSTATFGFAADNPFTTTECRLDGGSFASCDSPKSLLGLDEGTHTFSVRAVDRETVRDSSPASYSWLVDLTPPEASIVLPAEDTKTVHGELKPDPVEETTVIGWATVTADVTDALSGVASVGFTVNGVPVPAADIDHLLGSDQWSFRFEPDQNGENPYTIVVTATDEAGNIATDTLELVGVKTGKKS